MSRYRLYPTPEQANGLVQHCSHARYVWNLAVEQLNYRAHHQPLLSHTEQFRQLTEARREHEWLGAGSTTVQQQALRDFQQACRYWWSGSHRRPTWRKQGRREGFRVVDGHGIRVEQINRRWSRAWIPLVGWVRFRRTRPVPTARSFRVTLDSAGRWHIAFAVIPTPTDGPRDGSVIGIDRGVTVTLALSDGTMLHAPRPVSVRRAARKLSRCQRGSNRRTAAKARVAKLHARNADRRKDFAEKASTSIARVYDLIRIEDLRVANMTRSARGILTEPGRNIRQKAGLNGAILASAWTLFATRLEHKAPGRVERINPAYTSQACAACGMVDPRNRKNQAFRCVGCGHQAHADVNAAQVIAGGRSATARRAETLVSVANREPQHAPPLSAQVGIPRLKVREDVKHPRNAAVAASSSSQYVDGVAAVVPRRGGAVNRYR